MKLTAAGKLVVFEGPDGVGKTTLIQSTADFLAESQVTFLSLSFPGNVPGTLGELVYRIHHSAQSLGLSEITPLGLQALHIAAHLDAIESDIRPALANSLVLLDRLWWSTWAYGRLAGVNEQALDTLIEAERTIWGDAVPAIIFLIERTSAYRREQTDEQFRALSSLYDDLARREECNGRVIRIVNDDIETSRKIVRESIASILKK